MLNRGQPASGRSFVYPSLSIVPLQNHPASHPAPRLRSLLIGLALVGLACTKDVLAPPFLLGGDRLIFQTAPSGVVAGQFIGPFVRVAIVDTGGNTVARSGVDVTLYLDSTDPRDTLKGTVTLPTVNGLVIFNDLFLKRAANNFRIVATARGLSGVVSPPFNVSVGPAARLAFSVQPSTVIAGEKMVPAPQVLVQDAVGNTIPNDSGLVVLQVLTGPSIAPRNATVSAVNGVARYDSLRINAAAPNFTLTAVGPVGRGLTAAVSSVFSVTPGAPRKIGFSQPPFNNIVNTPFIPSLAATITDSMSNIVTAFTQPVSLEFEFRPIGNTAALGGILTVNAVGGVATFSGIAIDLTCNSGNCYRLRALSPTVPDTARSNFFFIVP